jgi:alcohol dehydrogenase, propanol-preferring
MRLEAVGVPLVARDLADPIPAPGEVLVRTGACGVCRTDLHVADGELARPKLPLVLGHQIVGRVASRGAGAVRFREGERVGITWLASTDGTCAYCRSGRENLCPKAVFTGYTRDGGYATLATADERFCVPLPDALDDAHAAPLLCAGVIGYRALRFAGDARTIGLYGFGSSAHIVAQVAIAEGRSVFAFTRRDDTEAQRFARSLGASWAGDALAMPPEPLDAAIIFAPAGELVPAALRATAPGSVVVCAGIRMTDIPSFPYEILWGERTLRSVANVTRQDAGEFLPLAARTGLKPEIEPFALDAANDALLALRTGRISGSAVLIPPR